LIFDIEFAQGLGARGLDRVLPPGGDVATAKSRVLSTRFQKDRTFQPSAMRDCQQQRFKSAANYESILRRLQLPSSVERVRSLFEKYVLFSQSN
jgi:hypothetical protein